MDKKMELYEESCKEMSKEFKAFLDKKMSEIEIPNDPDGSPDIMVGFYRKDETTNEEHYTVQLFDDRGYHAIMTDGGITATFNPLQ